MQNDVYSANKASFFTKADKELAGVLVATDCKDPPLVAFIQGGLDEEIIENINGDAAFSRLRK